MPSKRFGTRLAINELFAKFERLERRVLNCELIKTRVLALRARVSAENERRREVEIEIAIALRAILRLLEERFDGLLELENLGARKHQESKPTEMRRASI